MGHHQRRDGPFVEARGSRRLRQSELPGSERELAAATELCRSEQGCSSRDGRVYCEDFAGLHRATLETKGSAGAAGGP